MDLYSQVSMQLSKQLTRSYSSSFSASSLLFSREIRREIYAIYGLVRIADEIVDTYRGKDQRKLLDNLEKETYDAIKRQYSVNPIVHAFALSASKFNIDKQLIEPFFASMRSDIDPATSFTQKAYDEYIYGSAEVIGLMCLRVFVDGDNESYERLKQGAQKLGAAYQKTNFLRDFASDYSELGRIYFPGVAFDTFTDEQKNVIVKDIQADFAEAKIALTKLPDSSRRAVKASYNVYKELLDELALASADTIKASRIRLSNWRKSQLILTSLANQEK